MAERTLVVIKPDAVQRHLVGELISRFERKGFKLVGAKFLQVSEEQAQKLYAVHKRKDFYEPLVKYLCLSPVVLTVWEAAGVIEMARKMAGSTFGYEAETGTIRGDYSCTTRYNLVHCSDSLESAEAEIKLFFGEEELVEYRFSDAEWLYGKSS
jgi:nucleoside-diphosphate kinase